MEEKIEEPFSTVPETELAGLTVEEPTKPAPEMVEPAKGVQKVAEPAEPDLKLAEPEESASDVAEPGEPASKGADPSPKPAEPSEVSEPTQNVDEPVEPVPKRIEPGKSVSKGAEPEEPASKAKERNAKMVKAKTGPVKKAKEPATAVPKGAEPAERVKKAKEPPTAVPKVAEPAEPVKKKKKPKADSTPEEPANPVRKLKKRVKAGPKTEEPAEPIPTISEPEIVFPKLGMGEPLPKLLQPIDLGPDIDIYAITNPDSVEEPPIDEWVGEDEAAKKSYFREPALKAMHKVLRWEFNRFRHVRRKFKPPVLNQRCARGSALSRSAMKVSTPGPWLQCSFRHGDGNEYVSTAMPIKRKKVLKRKVFGARIVKRERVDCECCKYRKFTHYDEPDLHYLDYLEQVTRVHLPKDETAECILARYPQYYYNSLMDDLRPLPQDLVRHPPPPPEPKPGDPEYDLNSFELEEIMEEIKVLVDPKNRDEIYTLPELPKPKKVISSTRRPAYTYDRSMNTYFMKKANSGAVPVKKVRRPVGVSMACFNPPEPKVDYSRVKSRYMDPVVRKKPEAEEEGPPNPYPMPSDDVYCLPKPPAFMKKTPPRKPVFKQVKTKAAAPDIGTGSEGDAVPRIKTKGPRRPATPETRTPRTTQPLLSARLDYLSQPKTRRKLITIFKKATQTTNNVAKLGRGGKGKPKAGSAAPSPRFGFGSRIPLRVTPRVTMAKAKPTPALVPKKKKKKVVPKPEPKVPSGKKKVVKGKKETPLKGLGFDFGGPSAPSPKAKPGKKKQGDAERAKYRKSVLKMLEKAAKKSQTKKGPVRGIRESEGVEVEQAQPVAGPSNARKTKQARKK